MLIDFLERCHKHETKSQLKETWDRAKNRMAIVKNGLKKKTI